ncbi:GLEYA domain-containing protein [Daldinia decipiens]|uniref:GLEYA domain-containing protein n=1 Tax=Daldinia decipiens TaxID=326647 RepID=UPI0020C2FFF2|nr:GLEYA domain-containing protein [Daldinia decipiens]KAI1656640.1 GLEYA domain-containing protein [Daldinia decipiens]
MKLTLQNLSALLLASLPLSTAILPHCDNQGWDWAYYSNPLHNDGENYPGFRADLYKTRNPVYSGVTPWIGGRLGYTDANPDTSTFYGSPVELNSTYFALNHHAYLHACEGGTWQFDITSVDDVAFAWIGETAVSGWTGANADAKAAWTFVGNGNNHCGSASVRKDLEGNRFHHLRFVFANGRWGGLFNLTVTSPSGIIMHRSGRDSDWIVRYSCGFDTSASRFPDFGSES